MVFSICVVVISLLILLFSYFEAELDFVNQVDTQKWPPIDDEEFLRRCGSNVNREIALKVRRIVSEQLGVDYERVYPEQRLVEDLGAD